MPLFHDSIVYELSEEKDIEIVLDAKKAYDDREFGRFYEAYEEDGRIIIEYTKKTDKNEDKTEGRVLYKLYVVLNGSKFKKTGKYVEENYPFDERRESWPWNLL